MSGEIERDELGIKICDENCSSDIIPALPRECPKCGDKGGCEDCPHFTPKKSAYIARIEELQKENAELKENIEILKKAVFVNM